MQRLWSVDELGERWTLVPEDLALLTDLPDTGELGLAAQFAYWRQQGRFPYDEADLAPAVVGHLAVQVGVYSGGDGGGRSGTQPGGRRISPPSSLSSSSDPSISRSSRGRGGVRITIGSAGGRPGGLGSGPGGAASTAAGSLGTIVTLVACIGSPSGLPALRRRTPIFADRPADGHRTGARPLEDLRRPARNVPLIPTPRDKAADRLGDPALRRAGHVHPVAEAAPSRGQPGERTGRGKPPFVEARSLACTRRRRRRSERQGLLPGRRRAPASLRGPSAPRRPRIVPILAQRRARGLTINVGGGTPGVEADRLSPPRPWGACLPRRRRVGALLVRRCARPAGRRRGRRRTGMAASAPGPRGDGRSPGRPTRPVPGPPVQLPARRRERIAAAGRGRGGLCRRERADPGDRRAARPDVPAGRAHRRGRVLGASELAVLEPRDLATRLGRLGHHPHPREGEPASGAPSPEPARTRPTGTSPTTPSGPTPSGPGCSTWRRSGLGVLVPCG